MATIKSYTDIEQSRKLAEILPLESADMLWGYYYNGKNHCIPNIRPFRDGRNEIPKCYIPAWSLAALLSVLPDNYVDANDTIYHPNLMKTKDGRYMVIYNVSQYTSLCNNPVDACVQMIERLLELNLL